MPSSSVSKNPPDFGMQPGPEHWEAMRNWYREQGLHPTLEQRLKARSRPEPTLDELHEKGSALFQSDEEVQDFLDAIKEGRPHTPRP